MLFGIGSDIIEVKRMDEMVAKGRLTLEAIFTKREIEYCETKNRKAEHYAARFAAKEACLKAMRTGWQGGFAFSDIEIVREESGQPRILVHGRVERFFAEHHIQQTWISLSHTRELAVAFIILEN